MEPNDPIARMRAETDQEVAGMRQFAKALGVFFSELLGEGFSREEALHIATAWMRGIQQPGVSDDE